MTVEDCLTVLKNILLIYTILFMKDFNNLIKFPISEPKYSKDLAKFFNKFWNDF